MVVGWCPGLLAGSAGHAVGLSYSGWLACAQHGTVYVWRDPDRAVAVISQWPADVWEAWYLCMQRPELLQAPLLVVRPGEGVRCWDGAVGRERLYRAVVTITEDWYTRLVPVQMMRETRRSTAARVVRVGAAREPVGLRAYVCARVLSGMGGEAQQPASVFPESREPSVTSV